LRTALHVALDAPADHLRDADPVVAGFADSLLRLYSYLGEGWNGRFARHFHAVIEAYDREFQNRMAGTVPGVAEYLDLRRHTFAHWVWTDLLELSAGCELPLLVRTQPAVRRAALLSQDFAAWYNDLCSLPKELAGGEVHNLGISLIRHEGLSLDQAIVEVRRRARGCVLEFLAVEPAARRFARRLTAVGGRGAALAAAVSACVANMRNWFTAVYWFHHESGRYMVHRWSEPSTPPYVNASGEA
jgi:epi-isozizaene synthase